MILWTAARQASLSITHSRSLLKLMSIESVMPANQDFSMSKEIFQTLPIHTAGGETSGPLPVDMFCWAAIPTADTIPHYRAECFGISEVLWNPRSPLFWLLLQPIQHPCSLSVHHPLSSPSQVEGLRLHPFLFSLCLCLQS